MMLFIDAHFTDGALINGYMSATEAKVKALQDLNIVEFVSIRVHQPIPYLLALHSKGEKSIFAGSGTSCRKRNSPNRVSCNKGSASKALNEGSIKRLIGIVMAFDNDCYCNILLKKEEW